MTRLALDISEEFGIPVLIRTTTRISHSSGVVDLGRLERKARGERRYEKDIVKTVPVPMFARRMRVVLEEKLGRLRDYSEATPLQRVEAGALRQAQGEGRVGVITSGIGYGYTREAMPEVSILKLGMTFPLPEKLIREFAGSVDRRQTPQRVS